MTHVGVASFFNWVVVDIDNPVEVPRCMVGDVEEEIVIERTVLDVLW
jgi:hypothetical protein